MSGKFTGREVATERSYESPVTSTPEYMIVELALQVVELDSEWFPFPARNILLALGSRTFFDELTSNLRLHDGSLPRQDQADQPAPSRQRARSLVRNLRSPEYMRQPDRSVGIFDRDALDWSARLTTVALTRPPSKLLIARTGIPWATTFNFFNVKRGDSQGNAALHIWLRWCSREN